MDEFVEEVSAFLAVSESSLVPAASSVWCSDRRKDDAVGLGGGENAWYDKDSSTTTSTIRRSGGMIVILPGKAV